MTIAQQFEQKGIEKGIRLSEQRGIAKGESEATLKIAYGMLQNGLDLNIVMKMTGLTEEGLQHIPPDLSLKRLPTDGVTPSVIPPITGSSCPEIDALPEFLQGISRELYQHSLTEGHPKIFRDACKRLKEIIPKTECPYRPYTIAWRLWFRGFTEGFTESYISTVVNEKSASSKETRLNIAHTMLNNGFERDTVIKMTGLTEDDLA